MQKKKENVEKSSRRHAHGLVAMRRGHFTRWFSEVDQLGPTAYPAPTGASGSLSSERRGSRPLASLAELSVGTASAPARSRSAGARAIDAGRSLRGRSSTRAVVIVSWRDTVLIVDAVRVIEHPLETLEARARTLGLLAEIFAEVGSDHALIGGIAVGFHARKRATEDVDILVAREMLHTLEVVLSSRGHVVVASRDMLRVYAPGANPDHDEAIADLVAWEANPVLFEASRVAGPATVLGHEVNQDRAARRPGRVEVSFRCLAAPSRRGSVSRRRGYRADREEAVDTRRRVPRLADRSARIRRCRPRALDADRGDLAHGKSVKI